ncbi:branched-chain amino acid ABC transporter permease [Siccirubricoccus deserti]|uniref:Urea ABC transporter permease subunit UrtB n=1 Tax=Siccirubricoccus deserti TaxID=2013562 RepID=A0A9X0QYR7_9PROT|nr:urea ABC transporter permease subunit UrtB [Siccirubricoccus deserti]MBC4016080.1 urea ABC transporter permease subunit UrtB [Siccirubricoccus deserti]GGC46276.1 branched-chain amino acid ABC transporter permease [Siccirubricoccus deserti]
MKRSLLGFLLVLLLALPASAQDHLATALTGLGDGFGQTAEAVERLGALGDPRAIPLLRALQDGTLRRTPAGTVLLPDDTDAMTGAKADAAGAEGVRINNRVRQVLRGALGRLQLVSPDAVERLAAAEAVFRTPGLENVPLLQAALARETVPRIRAQLELALAASQLRADDPAGKRDAIARLGTAATTEARALLIEARIVNPELATAINVSIAAIEQRLQLRRIAETLFQGLSLGSVLLLAALGLAVTFGVMGVINMAHGEFVMLGAYATFMVQELCRGIPWLAPWALPLAVPAAFLLTAAAGALLERGLIRHLYGRPLETLLMTFGVGMILQQAVRLAFGAQNREVISPAWMQGTLLLPGGIAVTQNRLWIIVFGIAVLLVVVAAIRFTRFGLEMRAVVQNRRIAATMGIRTGRVDAMTFAFGSGLAGLAGVALSQIDNVSPNLGTGYIIDSFMVVVFGGVGSLAGTLVGALTLGVVNKMLEPYAGAVLAKVFVLVAIMLFIQRRPRGLFALKGRAAES